MLDIKAASIFECKSSIMHKFIRVCEVERKRDAQTQDQYIPDSVVHDDISVSLRA